jgi:hypothetical protein
MELKITYRAATETWQWFWFYEGQVFDTPKEFEFIQECYEDAVKWAMMHGPLDLCHTVIAYKGADHE